MDDKVILITGATSGLGKEAATELVKKGARVIIHGRNKKKAEQVKSEIMKTYQHGKVEYLLADFNSLEQVRQLARDFNKNYGRLDVLINNAGGIMDKKRKTTIDGNEQTLAVNVLSHFLLTALLFDKLKSNDNARIINLSSEAHKQAKPDLDDIQMERNYNAYVAYGNSKLYNILFTKEMHRRLIKEGIMNVSVNAMHPGVVATGFALKSTSYMKWVFQLMRPFILSPKQGADTIIYLASDPKAGKYSGAYLKNRKIIKPSSKLDTRDNAKRLWAKCEELTGEKFLQNKYEADLS
jgi:retinol dehydrogenase 12